MRVVFCRDSIRARMGPQFVTIRTTVQSRDDAIMQMTERRVMTFRSHGTPDPGSGFKVCCRKRYVTRAEVLKELNEAEVWIDMLVRRKMAEDQPVIAIQQECKSLCRIIAASVRTVNNNLGRSKSPETQEPGV